VNWDDLHRDRSAATLVTLDFPSADVAEFLGHLGCDAVAIDLDHTDGSVEFLANLARACAVAGIELVGRTACREDRIHRCLDAGITTLQLTGISSVDQVDDVIRWVGFPPDGTRGIGRARATRYGHPAGGYRRFVDGVRHEAVALLVHVESVDALTAIGDLAARPAVKALVVGVHDLAASAGHPGEPSHPEVQRLVDGAASAIRASGVGLGLSASSAEDARAAADRGAALLLISQARLLSGALSSVTSAGRREDS
jgi:4-hydroxy-2-oxoheptanedioate aldolase